jgi:sterol desaturase/sphingolipid hydroxylase (fatty acid hydroxylase superfamily)
MSKYNTDNSSNSSGGMGLCGVLTIVFVVLKLVGVIKWSWIWVLSPLWIGLAFSIVVILIGLVIAALMNTSFYRWWKD